MPTWHLNMTAADFARNAREVREERRRWAVQLRAEAQALLKRADEIDAELAALAPEERP